MHGKHVTRLVALTLAVVAASGCVDPQENGAPEGEHHHPTAEEGFTLEFPENQCLALGMLMHVPRDHVQTFLPEGFVAESAPDTYARGLRIPGVAGSVADDRTVVIPEAHGCMAGGDTLHSAAWVWIAIERPAGHDDLEASGFDFYEVCYSAGHGDGGHGEDVMARAALHWTYCGDQVDAGDATHGPTGWSWQVDIASDGEALWHVGTQHAYDSGQVSVPGLYRIWHQTPDGLAVIDLKHLYGSQTQSRVSYSLVAECGFKAGSLPAKVVGVADCDEARTEGLAPVGGVIGTHDMLVTFRYEPKEA